MMFKRVRTLWLLLMTLAACSSEPRQIPPPPPPLGHDTAFLVFFDWDDFSLSQQAQLTIRQFSQMVATIHGHRPIILVGHTDTSGSASYNIALSLRRAHAVKTALIRNGVPGESIAIVGQGESHPLIETPDGIQEPRNRFTQLFVSYDPHPQASEVPTP